MPHAKTSAALPLTVYVHLPWCVRKCPYCDFNSHAGLPDEERYVQALIKDVDFELQSRTQWPAIGAVFIGGGTPSLFSGKAIKQVLDHLRSRLDFKPNAEVTIEANPGTVDAGHFAGYRAAGVNRLSIGVQSFDNGMLKKLGRIHDARAAYDAFEIARNAGFDNINIDLMHGLPDQSLSQALSDLDTAIALQPEHLSWYQLTIEAGTAFGQHPPELPDNDACADIEDAGFTQLRRAGYQRYEVSAFAQPGRRSQHNLNYWRFGDYLGIGAGAHGKLTTAEGVRRRAKMRSPQRFMSGAGSPESIALENTPDSQQLTSEFALNTLRIDHAFTRSRYEQRTGLDYTLLQPAIAEARALGLIHPDINKVQPNALGRRHLNRLLECFAEIDSFK